MAGIWSGTDYALGEGTNVLAPVSYILSAPSTHLYKLDRLVWTPSVRLQMNAAGTPVPYWWVSAEVQMDVVFAEDGVDFTPDITTGDERILHFSQLVPKISYHPTAGTAAHIWEAPTREVQFRASRDARVLGSTPPAVYFHFTFADQHGVFATGANLNNRALAVNLSARAHWQILP